MPGGGAHQRRHRPPAGRRGAHASPASATRARRADASDGPARAGHGPGRGAPGAAGPSRTSRSRAWVTRQYDATVGTDTVEGSEHGAAVIRVKGTRKGLVMATDAERAGGSHRPVAGGRARGRRVHPQRRRHRRPRRWASPTASTTADPERPGGVLAAPGGRPRPGRRVPGAGPAHHRRQRQPVQRVGRQRAPSRPPARSASWACSTTSTAVSAAVPGGAGEVVGCWAALQPGHGRLGLRGARGHRARRPAAGARPRRPTRRCWRLLRAAAEAGLLRSAQDVSGGGLAVAVAECCLWAGRRRRPAAGRGCRPGRATLFGEVAEPGRGDRGARRLGRGSRRWPRRARRARRAAGRTGGDRLRIRLVGRGRGGRRRGARRGRRG